MTTFKSQSTTKNAKKEFVSIKAENQSEINQIGNFSEKDTSKPKTFIGGILTSKSNKQNKKDIVASDSFYSNSILSSKKQEIKESPTQSAEPSPKEQPVEETRTLLKKEPATEKEQPVDEITETLLKEQNLQQKKNNL